MTIDELVMQVQIALGQRPLTDCVPGDLNEDGMLRIDEIVVAVASAVRGCPTPTPSVTPIPSETATAEPTETGEPTGTATEPSATVTEAAATPTGTQPTATATDSPEPSATVTSEPTPSASATESATATPSGTPPDTVTPEPSPTTTTTGTRTRTASVTATETATSTPTVSPTRTRTPTPSVTPTVTPTATVTPTRTPTVGAGVRRFSLDPVDSGIRTYIAPDDLAVPPAFGFEGYLDLQIVGEPDKSGLSRVDVVGASEFLVLQFPDSEQRLCIRPIFPVERAGVIACAGGVDLGVKTTQDHNIGVVGVGGFTAQNCTAAGGAVEVDPHANVCNGPLLLSEAAEGDSPPGAMLLAPDSRFATLGIPAEVSVDSGPCETHAMREMQVFGFVTGVYRVDIADADNMPGVLFRHDEEGESFDCASFDQEDGPGRLVLSVGVLHGAGLDVVTVFDLDD